MSHTPFLVINLESANDKEQNKTKNQRQMLHKRITTLLRLTMLCLLAFSLVACDKGMFEVHPYDSNYKGGTNLNVTNISRIEERLCVIVTPYAWPSSAILTCGTRSSKKR